jgi:hypothetical protein
VPTTAERVDGGFGPARYALCSALSLPAGREATASPICLEFTRRAQALPLLGVISGKDSLSDRPFGRC